MPSCHFEQEKEKEKNKCMLAHTEGKWELSDDSSDDEEEIRNVCFMALENQQPMVKDDVVSGRWVDIILKKVRDYDIEVDTELKLDIAELLNDDLLFVETMRTDCERYLETVLTELNNLRPQLNDLQSVQLALKESVLKIEALETDNQKLKSDLEKEHMVINSWVKASGKNYDAFSKTIDAQKTAWKSGDLQMAALFPPFMKCLILLELRLPMTLLIKSKQNLMRLTPLRLKLDLKRLELQSKRKLVMNLRLKSPRISKFPRLKTPLNRSPKVSSHLKTISF